MVPGRINGPTACKVMQPRLSHCRPELTSHAVEWENEHVAIALLTRGASCKDEARIGQKNKITRRWAKRGTRPSAPHDQRTKSAYIFGAICPQEGKAAGLVLPFCNTDTMNLHLAEISLHVAPGAHAVLLMDQAGWHLTPKLELPSNISIVAIPSKCPELNPQENIWQFMRDNWLSNRVFSSYDDIVDHCCDAWNKLVDQPWKIMSIGLRDWAREF